MALSDQIFNLASGDDAAFEALWREVFDYQSENCEVYGRYCNSIGVETIPYLPIDAFKHVPVISFEPAEADLVFRSSGTGQGARATHYVKDRTLYERSVATHFTRLFGFGPLTLLANLPHYAEMGNESSLLYMVEYLIERFGNATSGLFLDDYEKLDTVIASPPAMDFIFFGAAFGLLDLIEKHPVQLPANTIVIETGGMKTRRREMGRDELHSRLAEGLGIEPSQVWSEYGMCELLSQCYTRGGAVFYPPPWMRFEIMDPENPLERQKEGQPGALAVIDLANLHSVSAILTQDRAIQRGDGFEVLGRLNGAELRGCNFLLERQFGD